MHSLAELHAPEFLEIAVTMPQAKLLYLLGASGDMHMSDLVARLGVSLSTVSGLVDRIVDQGLATRRDDPADRRQVVVALTEQGTAFLDRFRDLNAVQMRTLLGLVDDDELASVRRALAALARAADRARRVAPSLHAKGSRMSRLSELAVAKRSVTLLLAAALFIAGIAAWGNLQQELLPDIELPVITVIAPLPGAGAADVADQVTKPIERAISGAPRLQALQSTSANSIALVVAQFSFGTDIKETRALIEQNIQAANLPPSVDPTVAALNINPSPVIIASIAATTPDGLSEAARIAQTEIEPALLGIEGVASVDVSGGDEQQIAITLDPAKLAKAKCRRRRSSASSPRTTSPSRPARSRATGRRPRSRRSASSAASTQIRDMVVGVAAPGRARRACAARSLGPAGRLGPAGCLRAPSTSPVAPAAPKPITIGDLGTVDVVGVPTTGYARTATPEDGGHPSLSLSVTKTSTANTVQVADAVTAKLAELGAQHADVVTVTVVSDLSSFIKESRDGLLREGGTGALFAVLTIFLFLSSLRSTLVAAVSIPLCLLAALVIMQITGITLNILTLGGLAVAVGRVVDDAIVVLENIYRHRAMGEDRLRASINGPKEVAGAITAATVTTVGVFLPLGFVGGFVSQFFLPFALTVTFALLASLVCALTVVPVLAYLSSQRQVQRRRGRGAQELVLDPHLHARDHVRAAEPLDEARRGRRVHRAVLRHGADRAAPAHPVHQRGVARRSSPSRSRRRPAPRPMPSSSGRSRPRPSCSRTPRSSSSRPASPARARRASRRSSPRPAAGPRTAPG